jgi:hypothetical protein
MEPLLVFLPPKHQHGLHSDPKTHQYQETIMRISIRSDSYHDIDHLKSSVHACGCRISPLMHELWPQILPDNKSTSDLTLEALTLAELNLDTCDWRQAAARVLETGRGKTCYADIGPLLALNWRNYADLSLLLIMKTLKGGNQAPYVFGLDRGMFTAYHVYPGRNIEPDTRLVFSV